MAHGQVSVSSVENAQKMAREWSDGVAGCAVEAPLIVGLSGVVDAAYDRLELLELKLTYIESKLMNGPTPMAEPCRDKCDRGPILIAIQPLPRRIDEVCGRLSRILEVL